MKTRSYRHIWLVSKREFRTTVGRRSFWLTTFLLPLALLLLTVGVQLVSPVEETESGPAATTQKEVDSPIGYVDESGIMVRLSPATAGWSLRPYGDEARAAEALRSGQISEYYVLAGDYLRTGRLTLVTNERRRLGETEVSPVMIYALNYNLVGDGPTAGLLTTPVVELVEKPLGPATETETSRESLAYAVPYAALFILYFVLVMTGGYMLTSVAKEKENRTAELLLVSLPARDLMMGKILGLTGVGVLQIAIWLGAGLAVLGQVERLLPDLGGYSLPSGFVPWTLAYFLFGFLLYAAMYAALGVMARTAREAGQLTYVALAPLITPLLVAGTLIQQPHGLLSVALSLFPLTSPVAMVTRLAAEPIPLWQAVLGLVLLAVSAYGMVLLAARFFRVENLLSSRAFSWRGLVGELASRVRAQSV